MRRMDSVGMCQKSWRCVARRSARGSPNFSLPCTDGPHYVSRRVALDDHLDRWVVLLFYTHAAADDDFKELDLGQFDDLRPIRSGWKARV
jgi:hypothetical protein